VLTVETGHFTEKFPCGCQIKISVAAVEDVKKYHGISREELLTDLRARHECKSRPKG
jgi:hypothetical protein